MKRTMLFNEDYLCDRCGCSTTCEPAETVDELGDIWVHSEYEGCIRAQRQLIAKLEVRVTNLEIKA